MGLNDKAWGIGFKRLIGDASLGETYGIAIDETNRQVHICDIGDAGTDWARTASSHPELCIHSATTPETYYLKMYTSGATAYIDAVGATTLQLLVAGTAEISIAAASVSPTTTDGAALGTTALMWGDLFLASGGVINFNNGDVTLTHAANKLTLGGGVLDLTTDVDITFTGTTGTNEIILTTNLADALSIKDSAADIIVFATTTGTPTVTITPATTITGNLTCSADCKAATYHVGATAGTDATYATTVSGITVVKGIVTSVTGT